MWISIHRVTYQLLVLLQLLPLREGFIYLRVISYPQPKLILLIMAEEPQKSENTSETRPEEETELALNINQYIEADAETEEQKTFNELSMDDKLNRLNQLVQQSQVYSQIILDNMLEKSLQKKRLREKIERGETVPEQTDFRLSSLEDSVESSDGESEESEEAESSEEPEETDESDVENVPNTTEKSTEPSEVTDRESDEAQALAGNESEDEVIQPKRRVLSRLSNQGKVPERINRSRKTEVIEVGLESSDDGLAPSSRTRSGRRMLPLSLPSRKNTKRRKKSSVKRKKKPRNKASIETRRTKQAIEAAQTGHKQLQPMLVSGCIMKDYQLDGLEWLVTLYENGLNGILADEMGLGKTLQCIGVTAYLIEHGVKGPFLVVAPLSTVSNWCNEFRKFAPRIKVLQYTGEKSDRQRISFGKTLKAQVIVTSYEVVIKDHIKFLRVHWKYLTVDEGHRLKNFDCILIKFLKRLDVGNRLLLTGTPLQNNLRELWSLLNFILPDIFHDLELFQLWFDIDDFGASVTGIDEEEKRLLQMKVQQLFIKNLHSILKPFLLRRMKRDVMKDLPPKKEYILYSHLTPMQTLFYKAAMDRRLPEFVLEAFLKEYLMLNYSHLIQDKEDLLKVNSVLHKLSSGPSEFGGPKRFRKTRYDVSGIRRIEEANDSDLMVSDAEYEPEHLTNMEQATQQSLAQLDEMMAMYEEDLPGPDLSHTSSPEESATYPSEVVPGVPTDSTSINNISGVTKGKGPFSEMNCNIASHNGTENNAGGAEGMDKYWKGTNLTKKIEEPTIGDSSTAKLSQQSVVNGNQGSRQDETTGSPGRNSQQPKALRKAINQEVIEILSDEEVPEDEVFDLVKNLMGKLATHVKRLGLRNLVMQLRKICYSHYAYYNPYPESEDEKFSQALLAHSGKMQMLLQLLKRLLSDGHKVLIFSQFTSALDMINVWLEQQGVACSQLDGRISIEDREDEIKDFSSEASDSSQVFLLSTRAGGLGLNLVSADTVVLFDNDWNPQMDLQAIGRVHRIGQTKPVKIFRFVVRDTVEELLIIKSFNKRLLEKMVIQQGDFQLGRVAKRLADENIDLSTVTSMKTLFELGHKLNLHGSGSHQVGQLDDVLMQKHTVLELLSKDEMDELMDRSRECYARETLNLANVTSFETTNNMDE